MLVETFILLGSNISPKALRLLNSRILINHLVGEISSISAHYSSKPFGFESKNDFINQVISVKTNLSPIKLLDQLQEIEKKVGRNKKSVNQTYADREIDLDILTYNNEKINSERLKIPHPLILEREFVLNPLLEIYPYPLKTLSFVK